MSVKSETTNLSVHLAGNLKSDMTKNSVKCEKMEDVSVRTPPSGSAETSPNVAIASQTFVSVTQVTPSDGINCSTDVSNSINAGSNDGICSQRSTASNTETVNSSASSTNMSHPVSRRGGRFVSPSHRNFPLVTPASKTVEIADGSALNLSKTPDVPDFDGGTSTLIEFKTYRSQVNKSTILDAGDTSKKLSEAKKKEVNSVETGAKPMLDEHCSTIETSSLGSLNQKDDRNLHLSSPSLVQIYPPVNQLSFSPDTSGTSIEKRKAAESSNSTSQRDAKGDPFDHEKDTTAEQSINQSLDRNVETYSEGAENEQLEKDDVEIKNPIKESKNNMNITCRSPPRNALLSLDDIKSPGGGGQFWLSPGPPTPKSPGKFNGRESYMESTPTDCFQGGTTNTGEGNKHNNTSQTSNNRSNRFEEKCPDTANSYESTSNILAWLQSPGGLFSPGGYPPSFNNTPVHKTPRTPIVSTSFFFSDATNLTRSLAGGGTAVENTPTRVSSRTYTNDGTKQSEEWDPMRINSNVICVSPMIFNPSVERRNNFASARRDDKQYDNSLQNTPAAVTGSTPMMDLHNVFESPQDQKSASKLMVRSLPLLMNDDDDDDDDGEGDDGNKIHHPMRRRLSSHHLPPRSLLPQRSSSSSNLGEDGTSTIHIDSVHRHLAERDLMEDEDLSVLIQLAANHNPNTPRSSSIVFRSSPLQRKTNRTEGGNEDADKSAEDDKGNDRKAGSRFFLKLESASTDPNAKQNGEEKQRWQPSNTDFDPPPLLGVRSNSSSGSREIYVGSRRLSHPDENESDAKQPSSITSKGKANAKEPASNSIKSTNAAVTTASTTSSNGIRMNLSSSPTYPIRYPYSMALSGHTTSSYGGPNPPISMSGSMRVIVGGPPPPPPPASTSSGPSPYGDYSSMSQYPAPYGQYPPPPSSHHHQGHHTPHHHMMGSYPTYQPSHYPPLTMPVAPSQGQVPSTGTIDATDIVSTAVTPKAGKGKNKNKTKGNTKGKDKKNPVKRSSPSGQELGQFTSNKKKKISPDSYRTPMTIKSTSTIDEQHGKPIVSAGSKKSTTSKKKSKSSSYHHHHYCSDPASAAATLAINAAAGGKNAEAAALAAAILRGVTMRPSGKWQAQLYFAGKSRYIGVFDSREKAALAYEIAREKLKNGESSINGSDKSSTENLVNAARKAAFDGVSADT